MSPRTGIGGSATSPHEDAEWHPRLAHNRQRCRI